RILPPGDCLWRALANRAGGVVLAARRGGSTPASSSRGAFSSVQKTVQPREHRSETFTASERGKAGRSGRSSVHGSFKRSSDRRRSSGAPRRATAARTHDRAIRETPKQRSSDPRGVGRNQGRWGGLPAGLQAL